MHDLVIGQLTHAVGELRDRTLHVRQAVRDDVAVLDATSKTLDNNQGALRDNNARLAAQLGDAELDVHDVLPHPRRLRHLRLHRPPHEDRPQGAAAHHQPQQPTREPVGK